MMFRSTLKFALPTLSLLLCAAPVRGQADDLGAVSKRGKELMADGKFEEAIPVYRELVKAFPDNPGPAMNLGMALHMAGHEREAVQEFQQVLKLDPGHLSARLFLGAAYLALKEPAHAVEPLEIVVREDSRNGDARAMLGQSLLSLERYRAALRQFDELCKSDPRNPKAWSGIGQSYEGLARQSFSRLEKLAPESGYWLVLVAETRFAAEKYKPAFFLYRQALAKTPTLRGVHPVIAEIYRKSGHADWAATEEEKEHQLPALECLERPSDTGRGRSASFQTNRQKVSAQAECAFRAGRYRDIVASDSQAPEDFYWRTRAYNALAREAFSHLAGLPPSAEVYELLAQIHSSQKNYVSAAKDWEEALKFSPGNSYYEQSRAISISAAGNLEDARPLLERAVRQWPDSAELNYWLGFTLLGLEKPAEAVPYLERAAKRDPVVLQPHRDLARAYLRIGEVEKAIPHLKAALPLDEDGSLYYQLAQAYRKSGQKELESEMLGKFRAKQLSSGEEKKSFERSLEITPP